MRLKLKNILYAVLFTIGLLYIFVFSQCGHKQTEPGHLPYLNLGDSARYVGINTCKTCHQDVYETFIKTGMGQSFNVASHQKSTARFGRDAVIYDTANDLHYKPFWKGDTLKVTEYRLLGKDTIHKRTEQVHYIIGSGQHTNSHMINVNGYVYQAPLTFYTQRGLWDLPPGFEHGNNVGFKRPIGLECMSCHNAYPKFVLGSENKFSEIPVGINCERCHGPGSIHVREKSAGHLVNTKNEIDYTIVNPAKLPVDLQFEICQRCHLQANAVLKDGKSFFDFKPGMRLSEVMDIFVPKFTGRDNEYIMASHVERLKRSQCFIKTMQKLENGSLPVTDKLKPYKDALTCVTCHNPHVSVRVTGTEIFNNACKKCHSSTENHICTRPESKGDATLAMEGNCVKCHMPKSGTIDIPHVTTTDHYIRKPVSEQQVNKIKAYIGIVCINNPKPDTKTIARGYLQYFERQNKNPISLDSAAHYLDYKTADELKDKFPLLIYLYYLRDNYPKIVEIANKIGYKDITQNQKTSWNNDDAWMDYRIGISYYSLDQVDQAAKYLELACNLAPYNPDFKEKWAVCLTKQGKLEEGIKVLEGLIKDNPTIAKVHSDLGYALLMKNRDTKRAMECYNKALALDPDYEQALLNKAALYGYMQQYTDAKLIITSILKKNPNNTQAQQYYAQLMRL